MRNYYIGLVSKICCWWWLLKKEYGLFKDVESIVGIVRCEKVERDV